VVEHLKAGKLRALAATGKTRIEPLPDLADHRGIRLQGFRT